LPKHQLYRRAGRHGGSFSWGAPPGGGGQPGFLWAGAAPPGGRAGIWDELRQGGAVSEQGPPAPGGDRVGHLEGASGVAASGRRLGQPSESMEGNIPGATRLCISGALFWGRVAATDQGKVPKGLGNWRGPLFHTARNSRAPQPTSRFPAFPGGPRGREGGGKQGSKRAPGAGQTTHRALLWGGRWQPPGDGFGTESGGTAIFMKSAICDYGDAYTPSPGSHSFRTRAREGSPGETIWGRRPKFGLLKRGDRTGPIRVPLEKGMEDWQGGRGGAPGLASRKVLIPTHKARKNPEIAGRWRPPRKTKPRTGPAGGCFAGGAGRHQGFGRLTFEDILGPGATRKPGSRPAHPKKKGERGIRARGRGVGVGVLGKLIRTVFG